MAGGMKTGLKRFLRGFVLALGLGCGLARGESATYTNPVIAGDYPDPSVIRVGEDYWATATSSEWAPLFPILHSRNLVNWENLGAVFQKRPDWSVGNFWAPEISEHRGRYFVYYVGRKKGGPLAVAVASADRPAGPYTDHGPMVAQEAGSIDPVPVTDENGARWLIWKEDGNSRNRPTPLWAQRLSEDGTKLVGEMREILRNDAPWEGNVVEGAFVVKRGEYFYLFYSGNGCCGRGCTYAMGVARSKKLLGPWEKNPLNPILAENDKWKCPGHGSVVTTPDGRDYLLYHAYSARDNVYVGRQALLDQVEWPKNGWPVLNNGKGPSVSSQSPLSAKSRNPEHLFLDDFSGPALQARWEWPQARQPVVNFGGAPKLALALAPNPERAVDPLGGVLAVKTTTGNYSATATLETEGLSPLAQAGISAYGDSENALGLSVLNSKLVVWRRQRNKTETLTIEEAPAFSPLHLRVIAREGHKFSFAISGDGARWEAVGPDVDLEGSFLPPWDRGVRIALTVGGAADAVARFTRFKMLPIPEEIGSK